MAISGHRTRSVFDRYSLTLKAQTRAALERVSTVLGVAADRERASAHDVPPSTAGRQRGHPCAHPREDEAKLRGGKATKCAES
jgi:hypothetical protein